MFGHRKKNYTKIGSILHHYDLPLSFPLRKKAHCIPLIYNTPTIYQRKLPNREDTLNLGHPNLENTILLSKRSSILCHFICCFSLDVLSEMITRSRSTIEFEVALVPDEKKCYSKQDMDCDRNPHPNHHIVLKENQKKRICNENRMRNDCESDDEAAIKIQYLKLELEKIEKEVQCSICLNIMSNPHSFPCVCSFCLYFFKNVFFLFIFLLNIF